MIWTSFSKISMKMLLQMALFSEHFVLSITRFSLLILFFLYQKIVLYCCLFTLTVMPWQLVENCDLLWENRYPMLILLRTPSEKWPTITEENNEVLLLVSDLLLLNNATHLMLSKFGL